MNSKMVAQSVNYNKIYTTSSECYMFRLLSQATIQQLKYIKKNNLNTTH